MIFDFADKMESEALSLSIKLNEERIESLNLCQNQLLGSYRNLENKVSEQNNQIEDLKKKIKISEERSNLLIKQMEERITNSQKTQVAEDDISKKMLALENSIAVLYGENRKTINEEIQRIRRIIDKKIKNKK